MKPLRRWGVFCCVVALRELGSRSAAKKSGRAVASQNVRTSRGYEGNLAARIRRRIEYCETARPPRRALQGRRRLFRIRRPRARQPGHVHRLLARLSVFSEDWYLERPANAALKALVRSMPIVLEVFFQRFYSRDLDIPPADPISTLCLKL